MIHLVIVAIFTIIVYGYFRLKQRYQYWEKRRIPHLKSESLFLGNDSDILSGKSSLVDHVLKTYNALAPHKFGGVYSSSKPILYVRDPELIRTILIKDFHHFHDRPSAVINRSDSVLLNLFHLTGKEWDVLRRKLTPTFTSGKMKVLFELMMECVDKLEDIVEKSALKQETVHIEDLMSRYGTDVVSSCAFGLEADSLHKPNSEFLLKGKELFAPSLQARLYMFLFNISPILIRVFQVRQLPPRVNDFFSNFVKDTIKYRKENGIVRNDFLDLLMKVQEEETDEQNKFDINPAAQCGSFFFAGFHTSSNTLGFILYELAEHQNVQKKLQEEIDRVLALYDGKITYNSLSEMTFMDKVFNESTRMHTILPYLERICTADYRIPGTNVIVEKGLTVRVPSYGIHKDPQYYPDPDKFNPENFSDEAKNARPPFTFLPFGDGPRHCIGIRFGVMLVKSALTMILRKYTVTISPQMILPLELKRRTRMTAPKNPILLNFNKRTE